MGKLKSVPALFISYTLSLFIFSCADDRMISLKTADVDIARYAGTWYEIARFPHRFEKNLSCVTATYIMRGDGSIEVINKGYNQVQKKWKTIRGTAIIPDQKQPGRLNVSFFPLVSGNYLVIALDEKKYSYALVTGGSGYLWILSRAPAMEETVYRSLVSFALDKGFEVSKLERISHECKIQKGETNER